MIDCAVLFAVLHYCILQVGYAFPWSPVRWFPFANQTDQHEFHHSKNLGCFASKLNIYDKIFDSEKPYLEWRAKRARQSEKAE